MINEPKDSPRWLYRLISALDDLVVAAEALYDPDPEDDLPAHEANMDNLGDALSRANEAGSDVPNIVEWLEEVRRAG